MSSNVVTETWLAYAFERPVAGERITAALNRVGAHYGAQLTEPPPLRASCGESHGMALWRHDDPGFAWPAWAVGEGVAVAATGAPVGWERIVGERAPADAALPLARALAERPERLRELVPPFVIGVRSVDGRRMVVLNDWVGAGRLYELRFAAADGGFGCGGSVWSNRLGALPIFAGAEPRPDDRGWALFAAAGWFVGDATPIAGAIKVAAGSVIEVTTREGGGAAVERRDSGALAALVTPRAGDFGAAVDAAASEALGLARNIAALHSEPVAVDLSGGRDSRVSAAAAVVAGIEATYRTGDHEPGEADVARRLVELSPRPLEHSVSHGERSEPEDDLGERVRAIHLVHDGMRNPQEIRRPTRLPLDPERRSPSLSGHGGEIGHGFYYPKPKKLREVRKGGVLGRLEGATRRNAAAARPEAYELHTAELERLLGGGAALGIEGPTLLDHFYLVHRLAHRSGLGSRGGRYSACTTPAFVRAAFDLTPEERLEARLHRALVARLVPEWADVEYFVPRDSGPMPETDRVRIWQKPGHAEAVAALVAAGGSWEEHLDAELVRGMWAEVSAGAGHHHYEAVFNRVVWRAGFDEHLATLARAAREPVAA